MTDEKSKKKMQECLGLKPDGMFGPKTMAGIKAKIPEFNGQITQEVYDTIMNICRKNQRGSTPNINKMEPRKDNKKAILFYIKEGFFIVKETDKGVLMEMFL